MKRVLNSGTIKLPYVQGSEQDIFNHFTGGTLEEKFIQIVNMSNMLIRVKFTFEIKAPLLIFNSFQNTKLGTLNLIEGQGGFEAYLPPQTYKLDPSGYVPMDSKQCNELNTKLNNFYNWSFNFHNKLIEAGLCREQAELVLPQGLFTSFIWDVTAKDLITFIETKYNKSPELFGYCSTLSLYLDDHLPLISKWLKRNKWKDLI